jgi:3-oxoacid CoA-transferase B subunit
MQHVNKAGESKLLSACTLPITGLKCVKKVVTELGVFDITERGFELKEIAPGVTIDEVKAKTEGRLVIEGDIPVINLEN